MRGKQHLKAPERPQKHQENAFVRYHEDFHSGEEAAVKIKFEIVRCYSKCMGRLVGEGCHIQSPEADICMNGKLDHYRPGVGKVLITNMVHLEGGETEILAEPDHVFFTVPALSPALIL